MLVLFSHHFRSLFRSYFAESDILSWRIRCIVKSFYFKTDRMYQSDFFFFFFVYCLEKIALSRMCGLDLLARQGESYFFIGFEKISCRGLRQSNSHLFFNQVFDEEKTRKTCSQRVKIVSFFEQN